VDWTSTLASPRDVFREATLSGAAAVVIFHNHPSGDPEPSRDDLLLTRRMLHAVASWASTSWIHIILGDTEYCSSGSGRCYEVGQSTET
jgi:DNA repair protein RadC